MTKYKFVLKKFFLMLILNLDGEGASLIAHLVKNPPAVQKTMIQFLGQEDPLEKRKVTHSSILA